MIYQGQNLLTVEIVPLKGSEERKKEKVPSTTSSH